MTVLSLEIGDCVCSSTEGGHRHPAPPPHQSHSTQPCTLGSGDITDDGPERTSEPEDREGCYVSLSSGPVKAWGHLHGPCSMPHDQAS